MELRELLAEHGDISRYPPEQRILIAALDCIRESGLEGATVRAIASRAGVNLAAVSYYYRSKDRVIEEALRAAWSHVADDIDAIITRTPDSNAASRLAVRYLLEGSIGNPKVIRAIVVQHPKLHREVADFFRALFSRLSPRDGRHAALVLLALAIFISVAPDAATVLSGVDFSNKAARERLWKELAESLIGRDGARQALPRHQKASPRLK